MEDVNEYENFILLDDFFDEMEIFNKKIKMENGIVFKILLGKVWLILLIDYLSVYVYLKVKMLKVLRICIMLLLSILINGLFYFVGYVGKDR